MKCEYCDTKVESGTKSKSRSGHIFCSYECFEDFFGDNMQEDDDLDKIYYDSKKRGLKHD